MKALDLDLPNLEETTVVGNVARLHRFPRRVGGSDMFPSPPQNLRKLVVRFASFFPMLPDYGSITHLSLSVMRKVWKPHFFHLLRTCGPTLRSLTLHHFSIDHSKRKHLFQIPPPTYTPHWTTLELDFSPSKVTVVLAGAPEAHAQLSLRYTPCPTDWSGGSWGVLWGLQNFIPWKQLVAVTLRAGARVHTAVTFVANGLAGARGGKMASLRIITKRPGKRPELMEAAVKALGEVIGGDPQESEEVARAPLGLTSLELWVTKRVFLEQLQLRGRVPGLERIVLHCPRTTEAWVEQMRGQLPQLEVHVLKGHVLLEVNLPALDKAMRGDTGVFV
ncbi:uncharacterized protein BXZ73DRAFT_107986 [Epithele typhae]|uniref:uncharacterized protein n=1 Tax=Epithele typhae TaxID=378194 RepID=UPI0020073488|nr:uncharacterized protein BXZ73DRAFT_107986 [Epithele typhae]KAH9911425.1 hypothetical protein BXZ73DRAFT_107986 [Epithele typhae]